MGTSCEFSLVEQASSDPNRPSEAASWPILAINTTEENIIIHQHHQILQIHTGPALGLTLQIDVGESGGSGLDPAGFRICRLEFLDDVVRDEAAVVVRRRPPDVSRCVFDVFHYRRPWRVGPIVDRDLNYEGIY